MCVCVWGGGAVTGKGGSRQTLHSHSPPHIDCFSGSHFIHTAVDVGARPLFLAEAAVKTVLRLVQDAVEAQEKVWGRKRCGACC